MDCTLCNRKFKFNSELKKHVKRIHSMIKDFNCDDCGKRFCSNPDLTQHKQTHSEEKFPCHICGMRLARKANLIGHIKRAHTKTAKTAPKAVESGTELTPCDVCGKVFNHRRNYRLHFKRRHLVPKARRAEKYSNAFKLEVLEKVKEVGIAAARKAFGVHENTMKG